MVEQLGWHEWLVHTNFSFLTGASHPHEYLERALDLGYHSLAVCDYDGVYGLARSHLNLKRLVRERAGYEFGGPAAGAEPVSPLKLIHGAEFRLARDHDLPVYLQRTLAVVALNRTGYTNLCRLASYAHREGKTYAFISVEDLLQQPVAGLAAIQPMRGVVRRRDTDLGRFGFGADESLGGGPAAAGALGGASAHGSAATRLTDEQQWGRLRDHFGGRLYFAVSRHLHPGEDRWIMATIDQAKRLGCPVIFSQDSYFHEARMKDMSDLLQAIRTNRTLDDAAPFMFANGERSLRERATLAKRYGDIPGARAALISSHELAAQCTFSMNELRYRYPKEMIPSEFTAQTYLEELTWKEARKRFGDPVPGRMADLLNHELRLIEQLGFADYFLTVWDIVRWAREQNILCQGRGSAANSAVCFALGVTSVDPSLFDLLFERFMSVERGDPPDIDVDFEHERREEVIQYIYRRYGRDKAAMVANVITYQGKGALRAVGKAFGMPEDMLSQVTNLFSSKYFRRSGGEGVLDHLKVKFEQEPAEFKRRDHYPQDIPWVLWGEMAERLKGYPRHLGIHSGGFMLADEPLANLVGQEPATMENRTVVQWCKDDIEGLGFFKIDVLALGMLSAVRKCLTMIGEHYGRELTMATIPQEDQPTYAMMQRADTVGTFQVESRAQMSMLPRLRPRTFYDVVVEVAIIRPGPIQGGMIHPYLRRRQGQEAVTFPDERLRPILARTLGIPIFQEQVMRIAMAVGGFTGGEANELRRHMGAWTIKGDIGPWLSRLAEGMRKNGIAEEFVQSILGQMRGFADYGFPESHAVSFGLIAYVSCYLKCHYPAAFFASVVNSQPMGFYSPHALLQVAKRSGVTLLPVCADRSDYDCLLENVAPEGKQAIWGIRLGLRLVNSLSEAGAKQLVERRQAVGGKWESLSQLLGQVGLNRPDITALAAANAFAFLHLERSAALWLAEAAPFLPTIEDEEGELSWSEENSMDRIERDFAATSTSLGPHPVEVIRNDYWCFEVPVNRLRKAKEMEQVPADQMVEIFGMILVRQAPPSAKGMVFLTLEDETGYFNLVFTPQVYRRLYELVEGQAYLCVRGKVQRSFEGHSIMVRQVYMPRITRADVIPMDAKPGESVSQAVESATPTTMAKVTHDVTGKVLQKARNYM